jgi:putative ABC transport system ATP-binding protein
MPDESPIIADKISYAYGRGALRKQTLFDVSVEVQAGEIVILTGPSGSGKTTLITLMGALRAGQEGSLRIYGQQLSGAREQTLVHVRRRIGYIFQSHNLLPALDVAQNVRMAAQLVKGRSASKQREQIIRVLERVGMSEHVHKRIDQLSGGANDSASRLPGPSSTSLRSSWPTSLQRLSTRSRAATSPI